LRQVHLGRIFRQDNSIEARFSALPITRPSISAAKSPSPGPVKSIGARSPFIDEAAHEPHLKRLTFDDQFRQALDGKFDRAFNRRAHGRSRL
jgi:hypothetical protein